MSGGFIAVRPSKAETDYSAGRRGPVLSPDEQGPADEALGPGAAAGEAAEAGALSDRHERLETLIFGPLFSEGQAPPFSSAC